jgi:hypothetical protein
MRRVSANPANIVQSKARKKTTADLFREWGLPPFLIKNGRKGLRYRDPIEKGLCWFWFARYIRLRDAIDWGTCISCGEPKTFEELQCGHYVPADYCGLGLLLDERNNNGECPRCNGVDSFHLIGYKRRLAERHGNSVVENLEYRRESRNTDVTKFSRQVYLRMAADYRARYEQML